MSLYERMHRWFWKPVRWFFRIRVHGTPPEERFPEGPVLLCCNHYSAVDPICLCAALPRIHPHFMAKKELFKIPLLNRLIRALGAFPIARGAGDIGAIRETIHLLEKGKSIGLFPQGHRFSKVKPSREQFQDGASLIALRSGCPIIPVFLFSKNYRFCLFRRVEVVFGEPILPEDIRQSHDENGLGGVTDLLYERLGYLQSQVPNYERLIQGVRSVPALPAGRRNNKEKKSTCQKS